MAVLLCSCVLTLCDLGTTGLILRFTWAAFVVVVWFCCGVMDWWYNDINTTQLRLVITRAVNIVVCLAVWLCFGVVVLCYINLLIPCVAVWCCYGILTLCYLGAIGLQSLWFCGCVTARRLSGVVVHWSIFILPPHEWDSVSHGLHIFLLWCDGVVEWWYSDNLSPWHNRPNMYNHMGFIWVKVPEKYKNLINVIIF